MSKEEHETGEQGSLWAKILREQAAVEGLSLDTGSTDQASPVTGTDQLAVGTKNLRSVEAFADKALAEAVSGEVDDHLDKFEAHVDELRRARPDGSDYKEAVETRRTLRQQLPFEPSEMLEQVIGWKQLDRIPELHPAWFCEVHQHKLKVGCSFKLLKEERDGRLFLFVHFKVRKDFKPGAIRRSGVVPNSTRMLPASELLFAMVKILVEQGSGIKDTFEKVRSLMWVPNRRVINALYRFYSASRLPKTELRAPTEVGKGKKRKGLDAPGGSRPSKVAELPVKVEKHMDTLESVSVHEESSEPPDGQKQATQRPRPLENPPSDRPAEGMKEGFANVVVKKEPGVESDVSLDSNKPVAKMIGDVAKDQIVFGTLMGKIGKDGGGELPKSQLAPDPRPSVKKNRSAVELHPEPAEKSNARRAGTDYFLDPQNFEALSAEFQTLFVNTEEGVDLLESARDPKTKKKMTKGRLLANVLHVDKWSNQERPTSILETALEAAHAGKPPVITVRQVLRKVLESSTYLGSEEDLIRKIHETTRVTGRRPEWLTRIGQHEKVLQLERRILEPLGLSAVGINGAGNLCMVRTLAFLILVNERRLPPFCWRLTACIAFAAVLILGCGDTEGKPLLLDPPKDSLVPAVLEQQAKENLDEPERLKDYERMVRWPMIDEECEPLGMTLNDSLKTLILDFFARRNPEKKSEEFEFDRGLDYALLHIFPALTGKPFLVVRTVGKVVDASGNVNEASFVCRDSARDTVAVFDVFDVDDKGQRMVCTYGSYEDAQAGMGKGTKYVAFWTQLADLSHLEPIVTKGFFSKLPAERVLLP